MHESPCQILENRRLKSTHQSLVNTAQRNAGKQAVNFKGEVDASRDISYQRESTHPRAHVGLKIFTTSMTTRRFPTIAAYLRLRVICRRQMKLDLIKIEIVQEGALAL